MDAIHLDNLSTKIEALVQEHISQARQAAVEALNRAFQEASARPGEGATRAKSRTAGAKPAKILGQTTRQRRTGVELIELAERLYTAVEGHPGATMAQFAAPLRSIQKAWPMAWLAEEQAVATVHAGPVTPSSIASWLDKALCMDFVMVSGCSRCAPPA